MTHCKATLRKSTMVTAGNLKKSVICYHTKLKPSDQLSETAKPVSFVAIVICQQIKITSIIAHRNSVHVRLTWGVCLVTRIINSM